MRIIHREKAIICITTTPERADMLEGVIQAWVDYAPGYCDIQVYTDTEKQGVAMAKNHCLRMCAGYDHIFLADNDIVPLKEEAITAYVESRLNHAMYIFDRQSLFETPDYITYDLPRGCLLYLTKKTLAAAGGFDERFAGYGYEHAEYSRRVFNMGLTPAPYLDIPNSKGLFYSYDEHTAIQSSVPRHARATNIARNKILFDETINSSTYIAL